MFNVQYEKDLDSIQEVDTEFSLIKKLSDLNPDSQAEAQVHQAARLSGGLFDSYRSLCDQQQL